MALLFLLDLDDTLICTTYLITEMDKRAAKGEDVDNYSIAQNDESIARSLKAVEEAAIILVNRIIMLGDVVVVTNAQQSWLNISMKVYFPKLNSVLQGVPVVSAREQYQHMNTSNPMYWKVCCFQQQVLEHRHRTGAFPDAVISIGDGSYEREACMHLAKHFKAVATQTPIPASCEGCQSMQFASIKLLEYPSPVTLVQQLRILASALPFLHAAYKPGAAAIVKAIVVDRDNSPRNNNDGLSGLVDDVTTMRVVADDEHMECLHGTDGVNCDNKKSYLTAASASASASAVVVEGTTDTPPVTPPVTPTQRFSLISSDSGANDDDNDNDDNDDDIMSLGRHAQALFDLISGGCSDIKFQPEFALSSGGACEMKLVIASSAPFSM